MRTKFIALALLALCLVASAELIDSATKDKVAEKVPTNIKDLKETAGNIQDAVMDKFWDLAAGSGEGVDGFKKNVDETIDEIAKSLGLDDKHAALVNTAKRSVSETIEQVAQSLHLKKEEPRSALQRARDSIYGAVDSLAVSLKLKDEPSVLDGAKDAAQKAAEGVRDTASQGLDTGKDVVDDLLNQARAALHLDPKRRSAFENGRNKLGDLFDSLATKVGLKDDSLAGRAQRRAGDVVDGIKDLAQDVADNFGDVALGVAKDVLLGTGQATQGVKDAASDAAGKIQGAAGDAKETAEGLRKKALTVLTGLGATLGLSDSSKSLLDEAQKQVGDTIDSVMKSLKDKQGAPKDVLKQASDKLNGVLDYVSSSVGSKDTLKDAKKAAGNLADQAAKKAGDLKDQASDLLGSSTYDNAKDQLSDIVNEIGISLGLKEEDLLHKIKRKAGEAVDSAKDTLSGGSTMDKLQAQIASAFGIGTTNKYAKQLNKYAKQLAAKFQDKVGDLSDVKKAAGNLADQASDKAGELKDQATKKAGELKDQASKKAGDVADQAGDYKDQFSKYISSVAKKYDVAGSGEFTKEKYSELINDVLTNGISGGKVGKLTQQAKTALTDSVKDFVGQKKYKDISYQNFFEDITSNLYAFYDQNKDKYQDVVSVLFDSDGEDGEQSQRAESNKKPAGKQGKADKQGKGHEDL